MLTEVIDFVSMGTEILFIIIMIITWYEMPKWRTLFNYLVLFALVHDILCKIILWSWFWASESYEDFMPIFKAASFFQKCSVLSCTGIVVTAYVKLILVHNGKISYEKRIATFIIYLVVGHLYVVAEVVLAKNTEASEMDVFLVINKSIQLMNTLLILYLVILIVCKRNSSVSKLTRLKALMGLAVAANAEKAVGDILVYFCNDFKSVEELDSIIKVTNYFFAFSPVYQALSVLFNRRSRHLWVEYFQKRKRKE